jgi:hypothetical protein
MGLQQFDRRDAKLLVYDSAQVPFADSQFLGKILESLLDECAIFNAPRHGSG